MAVFQVQTNSSDGHSSLNDEAVGQEQPRDGLAVSPAR